MSKLRKFLIIFDNTNLLYFPGQFLTGKVLVDLDADASFIGLYIHVIGEACIKPKEKGENRTIEKENYIDFRLKLFGDTGKSSATLLSSGIHSFPFKLGLPQDLPSTFLGQYGWVQFFCKTALCERNGLIHKNRQVFIVMNPIDLNLEPPLLQEPVHRDTEHEVGSTNCLASGKIVCRLRLDKSGYVPGEFIHIHACVDNQSSTSIRSTKAVLCETIQYFSRGKVVRSEQRNLCILVKSKIKPRRRDDWVDERLQVPPVPPTNLRACHLIKISYTFMFLIIPSGFQKAIRVQIPLTIATYPFGDVSLRDTGDEAKKFPSILPVYRSSNKRK